MVLDLLAVAPVRGRFGIEAEDLEVIREWVRESGIRWGVDEHHRGEMGQPSIRANTWRFGLDRLLLAYAMHGDDRMLFAGVLPCDRVEGQGDLLGRFVGFCETLFALRERVARPLLLAAWGDLLDEILESMVECTSLNRDQHRRIREGARELVEEAARSGFEEVVSLEVLRGRLDGRFAERRSTGSFLARGVTFCALVPMRSIPFRVVCLLGMNDGEFPRNEPRTAFDELGRARRPGDRSRRDDDRYLFLESILSAREWLLITYVGRQIRDDAEIPPSVVVSELIDQVAASFRIPGGEIRERLVVVHPLQPFSPEYFSESCRDDRLFSYDRSMRESARQALSARGEPPVFLTRPLAPREVEGAIDVRPPCPLLRRPGKGLSSRGARLFASRRCPHGRIGPTRSTSTRSEIWKLHDRLLQGWTAGEPGGRAQEILAARGSAPQGMPGVVLLDRLDREMRPLADEVAGVIGEPPLPPLEVDLRLDDGTRLVGVIGNLWPKARLVWTPSKPRAKREIEQWVLHLVLSAARRDRDPEESRWIAYAGAPQVIAWPVIEDARARLGELVGLYRLGRTFPLPYFPEAAHAWVRAVEEDRLRSAWSEWDGGNQRGEREDPYVRLAFEGQENPLVPGAPRR